MNIDVIIDWKRRFQLAHERNFKVEYPAAWADGHYSLPVYPKVQTTNGLTKAIVLYLGWIGGYGNRINTMGRLIDKSQRQQSGTNLKIKKWLPSTTKKGTADIHCVLKGKHISIEIKSKSTHDTISDDQIKERTRIERAGGVYIVIGTIEEFFEWIDSYNK